VTREKIENLIKRINEIENTRPTQSADEIVARLSVLYAANIEGWVNGKRIAGRSGMNELDRSLFGLLDDYITATSSVSSLILLSHPSIGA